MIVDVPSEKLTIMAETQSKDWRWEAIDIAPPRVGPIQGDQAAPEQSLDAAHLYSYATVGRHHDGGGLLLRKDLYRLFDLGLIAINPSSLCLDLAPQISNYNQYADLQDKELAVKLTKNQKHWVQVHWENHRN